MSDIDFQNRIQYKGDLATLLKHVCSDFKLGNYVRHNIVPVGYEDLNIILVTHSGNYFIKCFADYRTAEDCNRYLHIMQKALTCGIQHPELYKSSQGYLYEWKDKISSVRLCVMEYIDGDTFYSIDEQPTSDELRFLAKQAALINQIDVKPEPVYDSWAVVNFVAEFNKKKQYLSQQDLQMITPLVDDFQKIDLDKLPHCFVHGDIIKTNVMRSKDGKLYILDFSVANYYPRIQELAVLFCDLFFNDKNPDTFSECYELGLSEYQKLLPLTKEELQFMPLYVKAAHAMHIICPNFEREANENTSEENLQWLELGRAGLKFSCSFWK